ncbi:MAG: hypothetical protein Q9171_000227 [Xanthocarpia ochracea]
MRKGRPHPTINADGKKTTTASTARLSKHRKTTAEPGPTLSKQQSQESEVQGNIRMENPGLGAQRQHQLQISIPHNQQDLSANEARQNSLSYPVGTLNHSTGSSSSGSLSPTTKHSTISPTTENDDDFSACATKSSLGYQNSGTGCSDCAGIAMQSLQDLTSVSVPRQDFNSDHTRNNQFHTASTSIKHLSAILICPCSRSSEVGLLNAALCAAILDSYWNILRGAVDFLTQSSTDISNMMTGGKDKIPQLNTTSMTNNPSIQLAVHSHSGQGHQQAIIQRVLHELPKAANVVMQLTGRYSATNVPFGHDTGMNHKEDVALLLPTLAIEQRTRLKDMIDKATNMMALVG